MIVDPFDPRLRPQVVSASSRSSPTSSASSNLNNIMDDDDDAFEVSQMIPYVVYIVLTYWENRGNLDYHHMKVFMLAMENYIFLESGESHISENI